MPEVCRHGREGADVPGGCPWLSHLHQWLFGVAVGIQKALLARARWQRASSDDDVPEAAKCRRDKTVRRMQTATAFLRRF